MLKHHGFNGIFIHPSGDLYYSTCDYLTISKLPAGSNVPQILLTVPSRPSGLAVDQAGNIFYTLYYQSVDLLPLGASNPILLASGSTLHRLALDSDENVFYTDSAGGKMWMIPIQKTSATTTLLRTSQGTSVQTQVQTFETATGVPNPAVELLGIALVALAVMFGVTLFMLLRARKRGERSTGAFF